jgi:hypothetical protein
MDFNQDFALFQGMIFVSSLASFLPIVDFVALPIFPQMCRLGLPYSLY